MKFQRGKKTVAATGTAEALGSGSALVKSLVVKAEQGNTGKVYPGASDVDNSDTEQGLNPGDSLTLTWPDGDLGSLGDIYIDVDTSGEGVVFWYLGR